MYYYHMKKVQECGHTFKIISSFIVCKVGWAFCNVKDWKSQSVKGSSPNFVSIVDDFRSSRIKQN